MRQTFRLTIHCPDQIGLVAAVSQFLASNKATIVEASHHTDLQTGQFFMRHEISADDLAMSLQEFQQSFLPIANKFDMNWTLSDSHNKQRVALLASKESHCLIDILHRWHSHELYCDVPCIIANHPQMQEFADWYNVPFHWIDFASTSKEHAFEEIQKLLEHYDVDVMVLARFMQILPAEMCQQWHGRAINIHHSFLPSFVGAKPYQQAYDRGVKLIGATCHYVTEDLDAGPIIDQEVIRISHSDTAADMVRKGKHCEKSALATGLRNHLEERVLIHGNKTVVFD